MNERDFERIRAAVDDILEGAPKFDEPINWGDLHCFDVQFGLTVFIEEAAPGCSQLTNYVAEELFKRGFGKDITVITEW